MASLKEIAKARNGDAPLIVERREVVAEIWPDPTGDVPMEHAAFLTASEYFAAHGGDATLRWSWNDETYTVTREVRP